MSSHPPAAAGHEPRDVRQLVGLCVAAAGVVYGDIGTSPLYTWNEIRHHGALQSRADVLGMCSLILWTLTLVVCCKYVLLVLRADNHGEGGTFALMGLLGDVRARGVALVSTALIAASCLLYGDGLITPAISVLSAVEGLAVANPALKGAILPITLAILTGLFAFQYKGTAAVGRLFGGIMVVWFVVLALLGVTQLVQEPGILLAISPHHAVAYFLRNGFAHTLPVLGSVVLACTGGEALYADMGHFGARAIRLTWWSLVYPCLMLNYLGQGALLLSMEEIPGDNVFLGLVPAVALYPMIALSTAAAVIASQALISGAFSLTRAAINLGLLPRVRVVHTSSEVEGQIYMPVVNWLMWAGCCLLVLTFQTSTGLAAAYGLAVMGVMVATTVSMYYVTVHLWAWPKWRAQLVFGGFLLLDLLYLAACALKFLDGGWVPLAFAAVLLYLMLTWRIGRAKMSDAYRAVARMSIGELVDVKRRITSLPRAMVFMTQERVEALGDGAPVLLMKFADRYGALPKHLTILAIVSEPGVPYWLDHRFDVVSFGENVVGVRMHVGYMETPDVRAALTTLKRRRLVKIHATRWTIVMGKEELLVPADLRISRKLGIILYRLMLQVSSQAHVWFGLGTDAGLSKEVVPVRIGQDGAMEVVLRRPALEEGTAS